MSRNDPPFVSYSINYEDVVLRRLFPGRADGFFVDVGAQDPCVDNDFFALSQLGWTGIDIEPNPSYAAKLRAQRPRDLVVDQPVGDIAGLDLVFYEVEGTGLSTFDAADARGYAAEGFTVRTHELRTTTLRAVLDRAAPPHIDVMKVDVEGFEERVLRGHDFARWRPSVIVVEVTFPNTPRRRLSGIPDMLEGLGYHRILFDNLNDFWAAGEFAVPDGATLPPNVFDRFIRHDAARLHEDVARLSTRFADAERYALSLEAERAGVQARLAEADTYAQSLQVERQGFETRLTAAETYAHALEAERAGIQARLAEADTHAQSLQVERQGFKARLAEVETYAHSLEADREDVRARLIEATEDGKALRAERAGLEAALSSLQAQLATQSARANHLLLVARTCLASNEHDIARMLAPPPSASGTLGEDRADG